MASEIPKHHIKQKICATRPPYREGRLPKAVKVYTVNNESQYILIQGVPAVGAMQELSKLCSTFGPVDQFNALDDYPSQDMYSEVYLIKYKKIQSARFAKRRLDEYSFFGGNLHVCYAPEHETVNETRAKLMDRRRVIALKIRQHAGESGTKTVSSSSRQHSIGSSQSPASLPHTSSSAIEPPRTGLQLIHSVPSEELSASNLEIHSSVQKNQNSLAYFQRDVQHQTQPVSSKPAMLGKEDMYINKLENVQQTFELPMPPRIDASSHSSHYRIRNKHELSRVPSSHATLPPGYDGRLNIDVPKSTDHEKNLGHPLKTIAPSPFPPSGHLISLSSQEIDGKETSLNSTIVVKKGYKPASSVPRFVPRQALKNTDSVTTKTGTTQSKKDVLDQEIRRNAFHLGESQGPVDIPNRKREYPTAGQKSVNQTIHEIRSKISKVINDGVKKK